jgi:WD40 repeat protein
MPRLTGPTRGKARLDPLWRAELRDHVIALAWSPDGRHLAAGVVSGPVAVLDAAAGEVRHLLVGHGFGTTAVVWWGPGTLASAGQDGKVRLWDADAGREWQALDGGAAWVERLSVSPDGAYLVSAAGRAVRLWDRQGLLVQDHSDHPSTVTDLAWRPGRLELAAAAYRGVTLWGPHSATRLRHFEWQGSVLALAWSPDGRFLATGDQDSTVHFWVAATGQDLQMWGYPTKVRELSWDHTGRFLATGGGPCVTVWDCSGKGPEGTRPLSLSAHDETTAVSALAFQYGGPLLASGGGDGRLVLWQPGQGKKSLAQATLAAGVTHVAWAADDARLAAGTEAGEVALYGL